MQSSGGAMNFADGGINIFGFNYYNVISGQLVGLII